MTEKLAVTEPGQLMAFLKAELEGWTGRTIKQRLRLGCVTVNGERASRHDHELKAGDVVVVGTKEQSAAPIRSRPAFTTIFADRDMIAIDKPSGLLSVPTENSRPNEKTALGLVRDSLSTKKLVSQLWPVHRLDRETSGVLLFARSREVRDTMQADWGEAEKTYLVIVDGIPKPSKGIIDQPLWEDDSLNVKVSIRPGAKDARTRYETLKTEGRRALLEVRIETGRRHQIRAHLAWLGHPVVGDRRYGVYGARLGLHATELIVTHPRGDSRLTFAAPIPKGFMGLLNS